jgi:hypothetical protein
MWLLRPWQPTSLVDPLDLFFSSCLPAIRLELRIPEDVTEIDTCYTALPSSISYHLDVIELSCSPPRRGVEDVRVRETEGQLVVQELSIHR